MYHSKLELYSVIRSWQKVLALNTDGLSCALLLQALVHAVHQSRQTA